MSKTRGHAAVEVAKAHREREGKRECSDRIIRREGRVVRRISSECEGKLMQCNRIDDLQVLSSRLWWEEWLAASFECNFKMSAATIGCAYEGNSYS